MIITAGRMHGCEIEALCWAQGQQWDDEPAVTSISGRLAAAVNDRQKEGDPDSVSVPVCGRLNVGEGWSSRLNRIKVR